MDGHYDQADRKWNYERRKQQFSSHNLDHSLFWLECSVLGDLFYYYLIILWWFSWSFCFRKISYWSSHTDSIIKLQNLLKGYKNNLVKFVIATKIFWGGIWSRKVVAHINKYFYKGCRRVLIYTNIVEIIYKCLCFLWGILSQRKYKLKSFVSNHTIESEILGYKQVTHRSINMKKMRV